MLNRLFSVYMDLISGIYSIYGGIYSKTKK